MSGFQERWKACTRLARTIPKADEPSPPSWAGIQRRRAELGRDAEAGEDSLAWWGWYGARGVAVASVVVLVCLLFAARGPEEGHPLRPGVEDAVAEAFWLL
jgi:hypothetical protein